MPIVNSRPLCKRFAFSVQKSSRGFDGELHLDGFGSVGFVSPIGEWSNDDGSFVIRIRRAVGRDDTKFNDWNNDRYPTAEPDLLINQIDPTSAEIVHTWRLHKAVPIRYLVGPFENHSDLVTEEELTIRYDEFTREAPSKDAVG